MSGIALLGNTITSSTLVVVVGSTRYAMHTVPSTDVLHCSDLLVPSRDTMHVTRTKTLSHVAHATREVRATVLGPYTIGMGPAVLGLYTYIS